MDKWGDETTVVNASYGSGSNTVEVVITKPLPLLFATLFLDTAPNASVRAVAGTGSSCEAMGACFVSLETEAADAIYFGNEIDVDLTGCGIKVNSSNDGALDFEPIGDTTVINADISIVGSFDKIGNAEVTISDGNEDLITTGDKVAADPLAYLTPPVFTNWLLWARVWAEPRLASARPSRVSRPSRAWDLRLEPSRPPRSGVTRRNAFPSACSSTIRRSRSTRRGPGHHHHQEQHSP